MFEVEDDKNYLEDWTIDFDQTIEAGDKYYAFDIIVNATLTVNGELISIGY